MILIVCHNLEPSSANLALVGVVKGALDVFLRNSIQLFVLEESEEPNEMMLKQSFETMGVSVEFGYCPCLNCL